MGCCQRSTITTVFVGPFHADSGDFCSTISRRSMHLGTHLNFPAGKPHVADGPQPLGHPIHHPADPWDHKAVPQSANTRSGAYGTSLLDPAGELLQRRLHPGGEDRPHDRPPESTHHAQRRLETLTPHERAAPVTTASYLKLPRPTHDPSGVQNMTPVRRLPHGDVMVSRNPSRPSPVNASIRPPTACPSRAVGQTFVPSIHSPCRDQSVAPAQVSSTGASTSTVSSRNAVMTGVASCPHYRTRGL